jgi:hypothetical protein
MSRSIGQPLKESWLAGQQAVSTPVLRLPDAVALTVGIAVADYATNYQTTIQQYVDESIGEK